jgi:hypothetical protein
VLFQAVTAQILMVVAHGEPLASTDAEVGTQERDVLIGGPAP